MMRSRIVVLLVVLLLLAIQSAVPEEAKPVSASPSGIMRILAPVRLAAQPQVAETRQILDKFQQGGFNCAVWAVDSLPEKDEDIKTWVESCLKTFPYNPIVAIDSKLGTAGIASAPQKMEIFLRSLQESSNQPSTIAHGPSSLTHQPLPSRVHSVLLNWTDLNNLSCSNNLDEAIAVIRQNGDLVRKTDPKAFRWVFVSDDPAATNTVGKWTAALADSADGWFLHRPHSWNAGNDAAAASIEKSLLSTAKPVIRGGFIYQCPRVRRGIETDLADNYRTRLATYETWLGNQKFAGYCREIGEAIPAEMNANRSFVLARKESL
jgi:hypothetical protein